MIELSGAARFSGPAADRDSDEQYSTGERNQGDGRRNDCISTAAVDQSDMAIPDRAQGREGHEQSSRSPKGSSRQAAKRTGLE